VNAAAWIQFALFIAALIAITPLLGGYMARVYQGQPVLLGRVLGPVERLTYRVLRTDADRGQDWKGYARSVLFFSLASWLVLYLVLRLQNSLPLNGEGYGAAPWNVSFNTASSFVTNTNWQYYGGETTLSYFVQMAGLTVQNFVSAAVGMAVAIALIRGIAGRSGRELGNFWADLVRTTLYILLPISIVAALFLVSQGTLQTLAHYVTFNTIAGGEQTLALGPVASQEAIKELGTNGGGFFNVNSAMPFENPSGLTNFVEMLLLLAIPAALTATFGRMVGSRRQGWAIFSAMLAMLVVGVVVVSLAESGSTPAQHLAHIAGANLEGKDVRFGTGATALWATVTTVTSCGAVNGAMESLSGLGAAIPMSNMMTGEVIFGGVGSGLYSMLLFVLLAVFLAGLMVGRTPEYLGKKIGAREIKLVAIGLLTTPLIVLVSSALAVATKAGRESQFATGPQGFSEALYAYTSQANNNGSAFAGYTGFVQPNAPGNAGANGVTFADLLGGGVMLVARFLPLLAVLAAAGALASKRVSPAGPGTMRTDTPTFVILLIGAILLVALLTFVPALLLGPVVQSLTDRLF
jgi:potassium-transporting ATPase potassium-binding subunit